LTTAGRAADILEIVITLPLERGRRAAFMAGLHTAMIVAAAAGVGALLALFAPTGRDAGPA
jgi:hypothetical protein